MNNTVTKYGSVIYKRVIKEERDGISPEDNAQISFKITDSITGEIPTKQIYYVPAYVSSTGVVTVDPNDIGTVGEGGTFSIEKKAGTGSWSDSGRSDYYLKIYFSEPVLINASSGYTITEDLAHTHSSWGTLIGHEATAEALKRTSGSGDGIITDDWLNSNYQWTYHDMDTFVNTTKTNKVTAEKSVEIPQGAEFDAANTYFTYTLEEKRNGSVWAPLPNISYTIHSPYKDDGTVIEERANYITRNKAYTNEKGQLQLRKDEWVEINVPQIATLRLLEDNTGKHRLQIDDSGNLTDKALVQTNNNAPTNLNVKEVNTGFTWDMDKTLSDGLTRGADVVITRLAYYDNDYWHMGIRFAERGTTSTVTSYADDTEYMDDVKFYYAGGSNDFVGGAKDDHSATIKRYTSGLLVQKDTNNSIGSFEPDSNVTAIYAYDATNKANSCKGPIIWLNSNQVEGDTKPATVSKIDKNNTEYTLTKITDSQDRIVNVANLSDGAMGYVNLDYCITNTTRTQELNIPEYIIVERNVEGNITLTKQKVVGIATNACRTWDDKKNMSDCTITSLSIPKSVKKIGHHALRTNGNDGNCAKIKKVTIENVHTIMNNAFYNNRSLEVVNITGDGEGSSIGNNAFQNCGQSSDGASLKIDNISSIGQYAFNEAKLPSVIINMVGNGVIDNSAFAMGNNGRQFSMGVLKITGVKTIGSNAFNNNKGLTLVEITGSDDGVSIGSEAFGWSGYQSQPNTKSEAIITNVSQIYNGGFSNTKFTTLDFSTVNNGNFNDNAITINNETKYLKTIIFGDGTLTMTNNSMNTNLETIKLIIFQNTNPTQLVSIPSNNLKDKGYYVVFTGLTEDEVPTSIKTSLSGNTIYYNGDENLTETVITAIETAVGTAYMNDKARNLLRVTAGLPALTMSTRPRPPVSSQSNAKPQVSTNLAFLTLEQRKFLGLEE